jgi:hypothetical protein
MLRTTNDAPNPKPGRSPPYLYPMRQGGDLPSVFFPNRPPGTRRHQSPRAVSWDEISRYYSGLQHLLVSAPRGRQLRFAAATVRLLEQPDLPQLRRRWMFADKDLQWRHIHHSDRGPCPGWCPGVATAESRTVNGGASNSATIAIQLQ